MRNVYVCSLHSRAKLTTTERETERERDDKAQGIVPHLFFSKWGSLEKSRSQLAKFFLSTN